MTLDEKSSKLVWLASYPKSGNTWLRIFLTNYLHNSDQPANINDLFINSSSSDRVLFDALSGFDSADLSFDEIDLNRPMIYDKIKHHSDFCFYKAHDAYTYLPNKQPLLGSSEDQCTIYLIRHPCDVAVSFAYHSGKHSFDEIIAKMSEPSYSLSSQSNQFNLQLRQKLLTWSEHVLSWYKAPIPKIIIRYEDMVTSTIETFQRVIQFLHLPEDLSRIKRAVDFSQFETLQKQEEKIGFKEKAHTAEKFFRLGQMGAYKNFLTKNQIQRIVQDHGLVMQQFGYDTNLF